MRADMRRSLKRLVERLDPELRLVDERRLAGGISAEVTLLTVENTRRESSRWVVRRHGPVDLASDPHIAHNEYRLLSVLANQGIKAPEPIAVDDTCDLFPTPVVVVWLIDGEVVFDPSDLADFNPQIADELKRIHTQIDVDDLPFLKPLGSGISAEPVTLDESMHEGEIRAALNTLWPLSPTNSPALLHGDYWPGNWLWRDGQLVGVIDWEDARIGDPLADLANVRLEMLFFFGEEAMEDLTHRYLAKSTIDVTQLPYWDLRAALRPCGKLHTFGLEPAVERTIRERHATFVDSALRELGF